MYADWTTFSQNDPGFQRARPHWWWLRVFALRANTKAPAEARRPRFGALSGRGAAASRRHSLPLGADAEYLSRRASCDRNREARAAKLVRSIQQLEQRRRLLRFA